MNNRDDIPQALPILPLPSSVFFPGGVLPLAVGRTKTIALIKDAVRDDHVIGVVTQRKEEEVEPGAADLYSMGTVARIVQLSKLGEDNYSLVVQGLARFRVLDLVQEAPYLKARVEAVEDKTAAEDVEVDALGINLKMLAREVIELMPELPYAATELVESIANPGHLADLMAASVDVPIGERQAVLETVDVKARVKLVLELLNRKREILKLSNKIAAGDQIFKRLRQATANELMLLAGILKVELTDDRGTNVVALSKELRSAAGHSLANLFRGAHELPFREVLKGAVLGAAERLDWPAPEVRDSAEDLWLEEFVFVAGRHFNDPAREGMLDDERSRIREQTFTLLQGHGAHLPVDAVARVGLIAAGAAGALVGLPVALPAGVLFVALGRMSPSSAKLVAAVSVLVQVRKRREVEELLSRRA